MIKAGLLGASLGFIYVMSLTLVSPFCTLCLTPLLGVGVGYLANVFDKPAKMEGCLSRGLVAGLIAGLAVVVGQLAATLVNGVLVTNFEDLPGLMRDFGLPQVLLEDTGEYWQATLLLSSVCGVLNFLMIAGLGALGGLLWFRRQERQAAAALA